MDIEYHIGHFSSYNTGQGWPTSRCQDDFCAQAQWLAVILFLVCLISAFGAVLCFLHLPSNKPVCYYCVILSAAMAAMLLSVGGIMTEVARKKRELALTALQERNNAAGVLLV